MLTANLTPLVTIPDLEPENETNQANGRVAFARVPRHIAPLYRGKNRSAGGPQPRKSTDPQPRKFCNDARGVRLNTAPNPIS
jgi:hypothetical protein